MGQSHACKTSLLWKKLSIVLGGKWGETHLYGGQHTSILEEAMYFIEVTFQKQFFDREVLELWKRREALQFPAAQQSQTRQSAGCSCKELVVQGFTRTIDMSFLEYRP
jgi:hypothetical protein